MTHDVSKASTVDDLIEWVAEARERTLELVSDLSNEDLIGAQFPTVNPGLWEIGHHAWFQSFWALRHACGLGPVRDDEDALYDSIAIAHDTRWDLPLPTREETLDYVCTVRDLLVEQLRSRGPDETLAYHTLYSVLHEDMHTEALTYTRQTLSYPQPGLNVPRSDHPEIGGGPCTGDAPVSGGTYLFGSMPEEPFVFDNEKWAHPVELNPFSIARAPVTQCEYAAFIDDGGYQQRDCWSAAGWEWRQAESAQQHVYWRSGADSGWERRHFDKWVPLEADKPVIHVNWFEADAYCRWAGRRLPREVEWEAAASSEPAAAGLAARKRRFPWGDEAPDPTRANLDWRAMGCLDVGALPDGDSAFGCRQMIGNVWEWTDSAFEPFPGFEVDPYKEYSEPWFGTRMVMRGGCWTTRSRLIRTNYRNFQTPDRRDVLTGFRTCAVS
jgi:iron(II)-dependent oxidoreductase